MGRLSFFDCGSTLALSRQTDRAIQSQMNPIDQQASVFNQRGHTGDTGAVTHSIPNSIWSLTPEMLAFFDFATDTATRDRLTCRRVGNHEAYTARSSN